ncbi:hypothetical protein [Verrucomicrobium sp. BvORR034]|uniref:hypothetical protein n=1 Tax=Verrucomicrobium sp. BvORR034 TaxID=1396418 RepID=UPI000679ACD7|nr:hypothetical protein [Verrucomicrobium sp. BvORR034]
MYLPTPVKLLLAGAVLYAGTYVALRATSHVVIYDGRVLIGSWTVGPSLLDPTISDQYFQVSNFSGALFAPLAAVDGAINSSPPFNDKAGTTPLRGRLSKKDAESRLPDKPDGWTVVGGWYEHQEKDHHESYHVVLKVSTDPVATDSQLNDFAYKLSKSSTPEGQKVIAKLSQAQSIDVHTFSANSNVFRGAGDEGRWAEIVVDDGQLLALVSWGRSVPAEGETPAQ